MKNKSKKIINLLLGFGYMAVVLFGAYLVFGNIDPKSGTTNVFGRGWEFDILLGSGMIIFFGLGGLLYMCTKSTKEQPNFDE